MTIRREHAATLELGEAAATLGLQDPARALDLVQVSDEGIVAKRAEVLGSQLVQRGSERAHGTEGIEHVFGRR